MIVLAVGFLAGVAFATGATLIMSDIRRRRHPRRSLTERLLPYYRAQVADEIEGWLRRRSP